MTSWRRARFDGLIDEFGLHDFAQPHRARFDFTRADFHLLFADRNARRFAALDANTQAALAAGFA